MIEKTVFKNGLRAVFYPMKDTRAVTLLVLIATGSRQETKEENGISHFLEHSFFKGTKNRPSMLDIAKELDAVGGIYNAFTSKEVTGFWVKVNGRHAAVAFDVLSDMLFNPLLSAKELEKEKRVIYEEINMIEDDPQHYILEVWENLLYGNQPSGRPIIGTKKSLAGISRNDLARRIAKHFVAENAVIALAGDFKKEEAMLWVKKYFSGFGKNKPLVNEPTKEKQNQPKMIIRFKKTGQTHLCLGVRTFNLFHPDKYVLAVTASLLGGSMSSRLFSEVREKRGLSYYVHTIPQEYTDTGYLVTHAGVDTKRVEEAIVVILNEYKKIKTRKVPLSELTKVKDNIKGKIMLGLETSDSWAGYIGEQEIFKGKVSTPEQECAKIDEVSQEDIFRVAQEIFVPEKLNLAIIGPFKNKTAFEKKLTI
ncbi:MAG: pitrilysin family protein [bacterium]